MAERCAWRRELLLSGYNAWIYGSIAHRKAGVACLLFSIVSKERYRIFRVSNPHPGNEPLFRFKTETEQACLKDIIVLIQHLIQVRKEIGIRKALLEYFLKVTSNDDFAIVFLSILIIGHLCFNEKSNGPCTEKQTLHRCERVH